jgi:cytoskeletal protein RodZ
MWEGPQGRPEPPAAIPEPAPVEVASAVPAPVPALGPARSHEGRSSDADITGAVSAWPAKTSSDKTSSDKPSPDKTSPDKTPGADRVPADIALAYAAQNDSLVATTPVARAAPMGTAVARSAPAVTDVDTATSVVKKTIQRATNAALSVNPPAAPVATAPVKSAIAPGSRYEDPWLRALVLAPDLQNYLTLTSFDAPDPRALRTLMHKPSAVVMMTFCNDPHFGMTSERFSGSAVYFVSTVTFSNRTAMLR